MIDYQYFSNLSLYYMKRFYIFLFLLLFGNLCAVAQNPIKGKIFFVNNNGSKEPAGFASLAWIEGRSAVDADMDGVFQMSKVKGDNVTLVASFIGYTKDTIVLKRDGNLLFTDELVFNLKPDNELDEAVVVGRQEANYLSKTAQIKTEVITAAGLCKMACCNLAESFENSASVSVGYSDAVTGAKQIKLLGLSGSYTQMLDENRPVMRGLAAPFGLSYIPGQWLESIQIAKGPSSVINGLEALTGQINMEHRKPTAENPLFVNLFANSNLRTEANIASSLQLNDKWSTVIMGHGSIDTEAHDENHDSFRDDPMTKQINFDNRWLYFAPNGLQIRFGAKVLADERIGGEMDYKEGMNKRAIGNSFWGEAVDRDIWGSEIHNTAVDSYFKIGVPLNEDNSKNVALIGNYSYYDMKSSFGDKNFDGYQNMAFFNAMYQNQSNEKHHFTLGLSGRYDGIHQILKERNTLAAKPSITQKSTDLSFDDNLLGVYGEYTYNADDKLSIVVGARADYSSKFGWMFAPRGNVKYSFTPNTVARLNFGRGFRNPNIIPDNLGLLSSSRMIVIDEPIDIEDAWTFGGNITQYFKLGASENSYISFDYFRTTFNSQMVVDWDKGYNANGFGTVNVYNCKGDSFTDTYQVDLSLEPFKGFTAIATFRYTNAKVTLENQGLVERTLTSRYKGVLNLQYATRMSKWTFDFTAQLNGPSVLPQFMGGETTEVYPMLYAQVTRKFKGVDVYVGAENITNYMQHNPIIAASEPYSHKFNASMVWGPLMGRMFYAGMRLTLWKK